MEQRKITRSDLVSMFLRSNLQQASFNFERIHGLGFCYDMIPAIKRLYPLKEDQVAALRRHLVFFNTTPAVCGPVIGVTAAMEEARANGAEIDDGTINGIKVGLMGPLAGVGDPLVWGTLRPITAALGASLALSGNILGPLLFSYFQCGASGDEVVWPTARLSQRGEYRQRYGRECAAKTHRRRVDSRTVCDGRAGDQMDVNQRTVGGFTNACRRWLHRHHDRAEHSRPTLPWFAGARSDATDGSSAQQKINPVWLIFALFGLGIIGNALGFLS